MRKKSVYCSIICLLIILAGCTSGVTQPVASTQSPNITSQPPPLSATTQSKHSFDDPNVVAYINGAAVNKKDMDDYIIMSKAYSEALANVNESNLNVDMNNKLSGNVMNNASNKWTVELAKKMIKYNDEEWKKEYYKTILIDSIFREFQKSASDIDRSLAEVADNEVNSELEGHNDEQNNDNIGIVTAGPDNNDTSLDYFPVYQTAIQSVANELGISFEDCTKTIYRAFYIKFSEYEFLLGALGPYSSQSIIKLDYGKEVKYNGNNAAEFESYIQHALDVSQNYIDSLLNTAEIVERP